MFRRRTVLLAVSLLALIAVQPYARSILEKKVYYISNTGKSGMARFWTIYLGNHDCKIVRKAPGQSEKEIVASMNLQLLSSGYVEGNGYGESGKVQSLPVMEIRTADGEHKINIDSILCIYDYGAKVMLHSGTVGDFVINVEGDKKTARKFLMREFKLTNYYGEEILKEGSEETALSAIAFSKEGLAKAKQAQAASGQ
ncbi:MAG: hypothetical protein JW863_14455 [Chitinispirillaceae bacterium]|nr:hypothetical protein [Chitinispirillaceae bacterium]